MFEHHAQALLHPVLNVAARVLERASVGAEVLDGLGLAAAVACL